jgi:general secretion pathway protein C
MMKLALVAINALLVAAAVFWGVGIYRQLGRENLPAPGAPAASQVPQPPLAKALDRSRSRYAPIVTRDLFGTKKSDPAVLKQDQIDRLKPTDLKLKLWGTVTGDRGQPYAVIEDLKTKQQVLYQVGDSVQNAAIKMIFRDKVVLGLGGKDQVLMLEEPASTTGAGSVSGSGPGAGPATAAPAPAGPRRPLTVPGPTDPGPIQPAPEPPQPPLSADDQLGKIGLEPQFSDGVVAGLKINRMTPDSVFSRMGLKPGDVIIGFNEQSIATPADTKQLLEQLADDGEVQVQIRRQGQQQTIDFKQ